MKVKGLPCTTRRVVEALMSGATYAEAARSLGLSNWAVRTHVKRARAAFDSSAG